MADDDLTIKLSRDQAFVLSDWLGRMVGTPTFDNLVNEERAAWSPLHTIAGTPDKSLVEVFMLDYIDRLNHARERLLDSLGILASRPPSDDRPRARHPLLPPTALTVSVGRHAPYARRGCDRPVGAIRLRFLDAS